MSRSTAAIVDPFEAERSSMILADLLVAQFHPEWDGTDRSPVIDELLAAHATVSKERDRLIKTTGSWTAALPLLTEFVRRFRMPVLDALRDRNGCADTFGESVVAEVIR